MTNTTKLTNGIVVLAHQQGGSPKTFANRTQAEKAATEHGGEVWRGIGRPFFVRITETAA
jgi:hypothetical protein